MYEKDTLKTTLELIMISSNFHDFDQLVPNCRKYHFLTANVQANWSPNGAGYFLEIPVACMAWLGLPLAWHGLGLVWAWLGQCQPKTKTRTAPSHPTLSLKSQTLTLTLKSQTHQKVPKFQSKHNWAHKAKRDNSPLGANRALTELSSHCPPPKGKIGGGSIVQLTH